MTYNPQRAAVVLKADAGNRALRTFLQGLAYVVLFAVALVLYNAFRDNDGWSDFDWSALGFSVVQASVMAAFAYLMRAKLDSSSVPTPLPPEYPGEPNEEPEIPEVGGAQIISNRTGKPYDDVPDRAMDEKGNPI